MPHVFFRRKSWLRLIILNINGNNERRYQHSPNKVVIITSILYREEGRVLLAAVFCTRHYNSDKTDGVDFLV